jgi:hypothetical protein
MSSSRIIKLEPSAFVSSLAATAVVAVSELNDSHFFNSLQIAMSRSSGNDEISIQKNFCGENN